MKTLKETHRKDQFCKSLYLYYTDTGVQQRLFCIIIPFHVIHNTRQWRFILGLNICSEYTVMLWNTSVICFHLHMQINKNITSILRFYVANEWQTTSFIYFFNLLHFLGHDKMFSLNKKMDKEPSTPYVLTRSWRVYHWMIVRDTPATYCQAFTIMFFGRLKVKF